jgi:hypothetical protein
VEAALEGPQGLLSQARAGLVVVDASTSEPESTRRLAARCAALGMTLVDAPLARSPVEAEAGKLNTMVGASPEVFAKLEPVFKAYCENIFHVGDMGSAHVIKLLNNFLGQAITTATAEAFAVGAKAGIDVKVFTNAVRSFLHQQFADHKFMFGVHTDKAEAGHIHAHAIVAVRSESGTKLHPGPTDLAQWRVNYASHAREHGLKVVATRAAEQASSRSYGPRDKSIVDVAASPRPQRKEQDRAYASDTRNATLIRNAQERMAIARANPIRIPMTARERAGVSESLEHWRGLAKADPAHEVVRTMVDRLSVAKEAGDAINALRAVLSPEQVAPSHPSPINNVRAPEMTENTEKSADAMLRDLRQMNQRIAEVTSVLPEGSRQRFTQQATGYLEKIVERIDQQRAQEAKANVPDGAQAAARSPASNQTQRIPDPKIPIDPLAELRRQQTEMLDRLAQERGRSRDREQGHEAGD